MAADLTIDNLAEAVRYFLRRIVESPERPVDRKRGINLWGASADDEMRALLDAFGGVIKITIREAPIGVKDVALAQGALEEQGANLWRPEDVNTPTELERCQEELPQSSVPNGLEGRICRCEKNVGHDGQHSSGAIHWDARVVEIGIGYSVRRPNEG